MSTKQTGKIPKVHHFDEEYISARYLGEIGWGVVADIDISTGTCIFWLDLADTARLSIVPWHRSFGLLASRSFTFVPGFALCSSREHPLWYVNHSCAANAGFRNWGCLEESGIPVVALRDIKRGEEITMDYPLFTTPYDGSAKGEPWTMAPCLCYQPGCPGAILDFSRLPLETQVKAVLPEGQIQGRVLAHLLPNARTVVDSMKSVTPRLHAEFLDVLQQQIAISNILHRTVEMQPEQIRDVLVREIVHRPKSKAKKLNHVSETAVRW